MNTEIKLKVTEIQRFCMHDGPGIRTTVFLKGCPLRCAWCHNPETQKNGAELFFYQNKCIGCGGCIGVCPQGAHAMEKQRIVDRKKCTLCFDCSKHCPTGALDICGEDMSIEAILSVLEKDKAFYGENGGITLSGGEPFTQKEATLALLKACKEKGLHTAVETCGYADSYVIRNSAPYVDLFLWDIKDTNSPRHKQYTGVSNEIILKNLSLVNEMNAKIRIRCILVNGVNTDECHYSAVADIAKTINNLDGVEWIPYHAYGGTKSVFLGGEDNGRKEWIPSDQQLAFAKKFLHKLNAKSF